MPNTDALLVKVNESMLYIRPHDNSVSASLPKPERGREWCALVRMPSNYTFTFSIVAGSCKSFSDYSNSSALFPINSKVINKSPLKRFHLVFLESFWSSRKRNFAMESKDKVSSLSKFSWYLVFGHCQSHQNYTLKRPIQLENNHILKIIFMQK